MKLQLKLLLPVISTAALLLGACNAPSTNATPTDGVSAVYTAAAQTIEAQATLATKTSTPTATGTFTPTLAPSATIAAPTAGAPTTAGGGGQASCDNSVYVSDITIPDNTVVSPGQTFDKTWALMNSGACAWTTSYSIVFAGGEKMGGNNTTLTQAVPSQSQANITVNINRSHRSGHLYRLLAAGQFAGSGLWAIGERGDRCFRKRGDSHGHTRNPGCDKYHCRQHCYSDCSRSNSHGNSNSNSNS